MAISNYLDLALWFNDAILITKIIKTKIVNKLKYF